MSKFTSNDTIWVVVEVNSGIPADVKVFSTYDLAEKYTESLRMHLNLDNDETGILEINFSEIITK